MTRAPLIIISGLLAFVGASPAMAGSIPVTSHELTVRAPEDHQSIGRLPLHAGELVRVRVPWRARNVVVNIGVAHGDANRAFVLERISRSPRRRVWTFRLPARIRAEDKQMWIIVSRYNRERNRYFNARLRPVATGG